MGLGGAKRRVSQQDKNYFWVAGAHARVSPLLSLKLTVRKCGAAIKSPRRRRPSPTICRKRKLYSNESWGFLYIRAPSFVVFVDQDSRAIGNSAISNKHCASALFHAQANQGLKTGTKSCSPPKHTTTTAWSPALSLTGVARSTCAF